MPPRTTTAQPPERLVEPDLAAQRVIPLRHPGRWIATVVVLVVSPFQLADDRGLWRHGVVSLK